jgi:hypothetical protein
VKKLLYISALLLAFSLGFSQEKQTKPEKKETKQETKKEATVYICDSKSSYAYHSGKSCSGIKKCKHDVLSVSKSEAVNTYGRRACKICY